MLTILLHSSKTMRPPSQTDLAYQQPALLKHAKQLAGHMKAMTTPEIASSMQLSVPMAEKTKRLINEWSSGHSGSRPAIDAFLGDIYSGLQVQSFSHEDRTYANNHLIILSGLYGALKALDSVYPYRLEMGYKLTPPFQNLYTFWGSTIAKTISSSTLLVNLSAVEYTKAVLPHLHTAAIIAPKFMTISPKTGEPTFVTVHAKIARGAYAHWLIKHRIDSKAQLASFNELGYEYSPSLSTDSQPVFICKQFKGVGLSVRLT